MSRKYTRAWVVLPPFVQERMEARGDPDILIKAFDKIWADPKRKRKLEEMTEDILTHFNFFSSGWGVWPDVLEDCVYIGASIGTTLTGDLDQTILDLSEEQLTWLEERCREGGLEVEAALLEMFVESREE
jgi:hypothetical protein